MASTSPSLADTKNCPFCDISNRIRHPSKENTSATNATEKTENNTPEYFFADEQLFVIKDIKPKAPHHYLVITNEHIESAKTLTKRHVPLVQRMIEVGAQVLKDRYQDGEVDLNEIRIGFHWPPLILVKHLHMHVFYPASEMSFLCRNVVFRPGLLFVTPDWLIERIQTLPDQ